MVYVVRHAQSLANQEKVFAGQSLDSPLTTQGIEEFTKFCESIGIKFDLIYASSLGRAIDSAEILRRSCGGEIKTDSRIGELDFGKLAGKTYTPFDTPEMYAQNHIESKESFYERVRSFYLEIAKFNHDLNIVVVAHAGVAKMLLGIANGINYTDYNAYPDINSNQLYELRTSA